MRRLARRLAEVSPERIRDEIVRIVTGPDPGRALGLLEDTGLLNAVLPEVAAEVGVPQPEEFHPEGDVFTHTRLALGALRAPSATLAMATLLHDIGKPPTLIRADRIRFSHHDEVGAAMARVVMELTHFGTAEAEFRMWEAYHLGRSLVVVTHLERAELFVEQFADRGLPATIEPE